MLWELLTGRRGGFVVARPPLGRVGWVCLPLVHFDHIPPMQSSNFALTDVVHKTVSG